MKTAEEKAAEKAAILAAEDGAVPPADEETMAETSRDVTPADASTPEGFDLEAWVQGLEPVRRAVTIYARADLLATIDLLDERIREARAAGDAEAVQALAVQREEARVQMQASALDVVVRGTGEDTRARLRETLGMGDGDGASIDQNLAFIAAHIEAPEGLDAGVLRRIWEATPTQADAIARAMTLANQQVPILPAPFSRAS